MPAHVVLVVTLLTAAMGVPTIRTPVAVPSRGTAQKGPAAVIVATISVGDGDDDTDGDVQRRGHGATLQRTPSTSRGYDRRSLQSAAHAAALAAVEQMFQERFGDVTPSRHW